MAKYVCDTDQVIATGKKLSDTANKMESSISKYSSNVTSDLDTWDGEAKSAFEAQCQAQVKIAKNNAKEAKKLGEFIESSARSIESLENQLASMNI